MHKEEAEIQMQIAIDKAADAGVRTGDYWIEQIDTEGLFQLPSLPLPRHKYKVATDVDIIKGKTSVQVWHEDGAYIGRYERDHAQFHQTFEPFRQSGREYALISPRHTGIAVMDLENGCIIAELADDADPFSPVAFYVPDWWDLNDGSVLPGSTHWHTDLEWPTGDFGFVIGAAPSDDHTWKVQYLDLSAIRDGIIRRDDRFGYVELAWTTEDNPADAIFCRLLNGRPQVSFAVLEHFDLFGKRLATLDV